MVRRAADWGRRRTGLTEGAGRGTDHYREQAGRTWELYGEAKIPARIEGAPRPGMVLWPSLTGLGCF